MKSIKSKTDRSSISSRIGLLTQNTPSKWGIMNANEMLCHCTDQILLARGIIQIKDDGIFLKRTLLKNLILLGMPVPRGKIKTYKKLDTKKDGTQPTLFDTDKKKLLSAVESFDSEFKDNLVVVHPTFGSLNKNEWSRLIYIHLNHHLKQFGK